MRLAYWAGGCPLRIKHPRQLECLFHSHHRSPSFADGSVSQANWDLHSFFAFKPMKQCLGICVLDRFKDAIQDSRRGRSGAVSDVNVEVLSGAPGLDSSARRAVDRAQPFPPLPDGFADDFVDIAVRFTVSEGRR